jgi:hypothetical protein
MAAAGRLLDLRTRHRGEDDPRWRDVDLDGRQITIAGSAAFVAGERIEGTTKSGRSRVVSIDADTVQTIKNHRQRQDADRLAAGDEWEGHRE